jgi:branched-chain amino acid transport system ATP-binding protein
LEVTYGPVRAVKGVDLELPRGEIRAILGANGAGKSSIIKTIMGLIKSRAGTIMFANTPIQRLPPHTVNRLGIAWVPEGREIFSTLTVQENLLMGAFGGRQAEELLARQEQIMAMFPILQARRAQLAGSLSGGEQQMLAIGRALCRGSMSICDNISRTMQGPSILLRKVDRCSKDLYLEDFPCCLCVRQRSKLSTHC